MKIEKKSKKSPLLYIIGLGMAEEKCAGIPEAKAADAIIGGRRLFDFFKDYAGEKIPVTADLPSLLGRITDNLQAGKTQAVLCNGDPLYFSLGSKVIAHIREKAPQFAGGIRIIPATGSLQAAAAILGLPWENIRSVSLHGREDWFPLAHALLSGEHILILTDDKSHPDVLTAFLRERGFDNYRIHILEDMYEDGKTGAVKPKIYVTLSLDEAESWNIRGGNGVLRSILLERLEDKEGGKAGSFGLEDSLLVRDKNIFTKQPVRAAGLAALAIRPADTVWDIGAGSGAVSIEASRLAWRGKVIAFEKNAGRSAHIKQNRRTFKAPNLEIIQGDFPDILKKLPSGKGESLLPWFLQEKPQRIFIGGGLGEGRKPDAAIRSEVLEEAWNYLAPGGRIVVHCVLLKSLETARRALEELGAETEIITVQAGRAEPLGGDMFIKAQNPVFLVCADKS